MERRILVTDVFSPRMLTKFLVDLRKLESEGTEDINILISSPGGQVAVLDTMLSLIEASPCNFNTFAAGIAASCGFFLFTLGAKGGERLVFPHTQLMCHSASGYQEDIEEDDTDIETINARVITKLADLTNRSIAELEEYFTRDYYFMGSDCVTEGFATGVVDIS